MDSNPRSPGRSRWAARVLVLVVSVGGACEFAGPACAQFADPDLWSTDGTVATLARSGDTLYAGGRFTYVGPPNGSCVALGLGGGMPLANWPRFNGRVDAIVPDGHGGWFVGGLFTRVNGAARANLVRVRPDGAIDPSAPAADGAVRALALSGNTLVVGGEFRHLGGAARDRIAAVDAMTGTVMSWNPGASGAVLTLLALDDRLYVGGAFTTLAGQPRSRVGAFAPGPGALEPWSPAVNGDVNVMAAGNGALYMGGYFTAVNGQPRASAAGFDVSSGALTAWDPALLGGTIVYSLLVHEARVFIGGWFSTSHYQTRPGLAAVDAATGATLAWTADLAETWNGPIVSAMAISGGVLLAGGAFDAVGGGKRTNLAAVDAATGELLDWQGGSDGNIFALAVRGDTVLAGGWTRSCGGVSRANVASFDLTSGAATDWAPTTNKDVYAIVPAGDTVLLGGSFSLANGQQRYGAAAVGALTGSLSTWSPVVSGSVYAMLVHDGLVHLGGYFDSVNGVLRSHLAAVDSETGQLAPWNPAADYAVFALALDSDTMYVGGMFWHVGGQERHVLAALDATTGAATAWNPNVTGTVYAIAVNDERVYAGGMITSVGQEAAGGLAAISRVTAMPDPWASLMGNGLVTCLALDGGTLYAGGDFMTSPQFGRREGLAAFASETGSLTPWWFLMDGSSVLAIAAHEGLVYVGGGFISADTAICRGLVRLRPQDTSPPSVAAAPVEDTRIGDPAAIVWSASDDFRVESVDAELSRHGPGGPWEALFVGAPNTGSLQWTATGPPSDSCWLRVRVRDFQGNVAVSGTDGPFRLTAPVAGAPATTAPAALALGGPAPSPARTSSRVSFDLPRRTSVRIAVLDVLGREVARVRDGWFDPGRHEATLDVRAFAPGLYFVNLQSDGARVTRRLVVIGP